MCRWMYRLSYGLCLVMLNIRTAWPMCLPTRYRTHALKLPGSSYGHGIDMNTYGELITLENEAKENARRATCRRHNMEYFTAVQCIKEYALNAYDEIMDNLDEFMDSTNQICEFEPCVGGVLQNLRKIKDEMKQWQI